MKAGDLRHYIIVDKKTTARDAAGGQVVTWTSNFSAWAAIWPISGKEYFSAQQPQAAVTARIRMRYRTFAASTKMTPDNTRIRNGFQTYDVQAVINKEEREIYLDFMCKESV